ncbi:MAG: hypothetical protein ACSLE8_20590 [Rhodococcus sp. (in: high G+C Gram-positive bacteria)]
MSSSTLVPEGTGSGASGADPGDEEWRALIPRPSPLDDQRLSEGDKERLYEGWQSAMAACMRAKGFEIDIASYDATAGSRSVIRTPIEPSVVAQYGYHLPPGAEQPDPMGPNERRAAGSCVHGGAVRHRPLVSRRLQGRAVRSRVRRRRKLLAVGSADRQRAGGAVDRARRVDQSAGTRRCGRSCMSARGFEYEAPDRPASLFAGEPAVTATEIATRQADIDCQLETRYVETTSGWLADDVQAWLDANAQTVNEYLSLKDDYLRNLAEIRSSLGLA